MCAGPCHSGHSLKVPASWKRCGCWSPVQTVGYEANSDLSQADHSYHMEHVCTDLPWLQPRNACLIPQHLHILSHVFKKLHLNQISGNRARITVMIHGTSGLLNKAIMTSLYSTMLHRQCDEWLRVHQMITVLVCFYVWGPDAKSTHTLERLREVLQAKTDDRDGLFFD